MGSLVIYEPDHLAESEIRSGSNADLNRPSRRVNYSLKIPLGARVQPVRTRV